MWRATSVAIRLPNADVEHTCSSIDLARDSLEQPFQQRLRHFGVDLECGKGLRQQLPAEFNAIRPD